MENQYFERIIQFFEENDGNNKDWSVFTTLVEDQVWSCADSLVLTEYGVQFIDMIEAYFDRLIYPSQAKTFLLLYLEETNNPLLYKHIWSSILTNIHSFETDENKRIEKIAKNRFESTDQTFIKEKTLEALVLLTLSDKISRFKTLALLEDLSSDWPPYLAMKAIKLLGYLYDKQPEEEIIKIIEGVITATDSRVLSEAAQNIGVIRLRKALECSDATEMMSELTEAHKWFAQADCVIENRDDAKFYKIVVKVFIHLLGSKYFEEDQFEELDTIISKRLLFTDSYSQDVIFETKVFELIQNLKLGLQKLENIHSWLDISKEILDLASIYSFHRQICFRESFYSLFNKSIKEHILLPHVQTSIYHSLYPAKKKLELLRNQHLSSFNDEEIEFVDALLDYCIANHDRTETKKKELRDKALIKLAINHNENLTQIVQELDKSIEDGNFEEYLISKIGYLGELLFEKNSKEFETGYFAGTEILFEIRSEIKQILPNYPEKKLTAYITVLKEVVRYCIYVNDVQRNDRKRRERNFLFSKDAGGLGQDASEEDLQQDFFDFLLAGSKIAQFIEWEKTNVASGRVDIRVNFGDFRIPIEIKKEFRNVSQEHIKSVYISQAQTYTASYEQLGIFMVLDLTKKIKEQPPVNIRDHFYLANMKPQADIVVKHPDYVTVALVTGNRPTPTLRSTYSRK